MNRRSTWSPQCDNPGPGGDLDSCAVTGPGVLKRCAPRRHGAGSGRSGDPSSTKGCGAEGDSGSFPSAVPSYRDEGTATRQQEMTGDGPSGPVWVRQRVTSFPDPASAAAYMAAAQAHWGYCTGNVVVVTRHGAAESRTLASLGVQENILAVSDTARGSNGSGLRTGPRHQVERAHRCRRVRRGATAAGRRRGRGGAGQDYDDVTSNQTPTDPSVEPNQPGLRCRSAARSATADQSLRHLPPADPSDNQHHR